MFGFFYILLYYRKAEDLKLNPILKIGIIMASFDKLKRKLARDVFGGNLPAWQPIWWGNVEAECIEHGGTSYIAYNYAIFVQQGDSERCYADNTEVVYQEQTVLFRARGFPLGSNIPVIVDSKVVSVPYCPKCQTVPRKNINQWVSSQSTLF